MTENWLREELTHTVERICAGCGRRGPGMHPPGWTIEQVREPVGLKRVPMVVAERPLCPDCQASR